MVPAACAHVYAVFLEVNVFSCKWSFGSLFPEYVELVWSEDTLPLVFCLLYSSLPGHLRSSQRLDTCTVGSRRRSCRLDS
jgi:hypothetical protein